jgi:hypothetical protein
MEYISVIGVFRGFRAAIDLHPAGLIGVSADFVIRIWRERAEARFSADWDVNCAQEDAHARETRSAQG